MMSLFLFNFIYCHVTMIVEYIYYANISKFQRRNFNTVCLFFDVSSDFQRRSIGKLYSNCCVVNYIQCFVCSLPFLTSLIFQISSVEQCYRTYFVVSSNMLSCFHPFLYLLCDISSLPIYLQSEPIFISTIYIYLGYSTFFSFQSDYFKNDQLKCDLNMTKKQFEKSLTNISKIIIQIKKPNRTSGIYARLRGSLLSLRIYYNIQTILQRNVHLCLWETYTNRFDTVPATHNTFSVPYSVTKNTIRCNACDAKGMMSPFWDLVT